MAKTRQQSNTSGARAQARFRERKKHEDAQKSKHIEELQRQNMLLSRLVQERAEVRQVPLDNINVALSPERPVQDSRSSSPQHEDTIDFLSLPASIATRTEAWSDGPEAAGIEVPYPAVVEPARTADHGDVHCEIEHIARDKLGTTDLTWESASCGESLPPNYFDLDYESPERPSHGQSAATAAAASGVDSRMTQVDDRGSIQSLTKSDALSTNQICQKRGTMNQGLVSGSSGLFDGSLSDSSLVCPPSLLPALPPSPYPHATAWSQPTPVSSNAESGIFAVRYMLDVVQNQLRQERLMYQQPFASF
ncbi:Hypothetical protein D9617_46g064340 [Elsinoe fawcettii]|nr:Hypothetical protein D9617_46g064340 [Elsinoe fawcettii]